jgi:uncharacterized protein (UPF0335 family)
MLEATFNFIFAEVTKEIASVTRDDNQARSVIKRMEGVKPDICKEYDAIRADIKDKYMEFKENGSDDAGTREGESRRLLDRHKVAAAFMLAFMNKFKDDEANLSQELMAILIGQLILKIVITDENRNCRDDSILLAIERQRGFRYPPCIRNTHGDYLYNWALGIHYGRLSGHSSVLSLSNELFWLERYNRDAIGNS